MKDGKLILNHLLGFDQFEIFDAERLEYSHKGKKLKGYIIELGHIEHKNILPKSPYGIFTVI